MPNIVWVITQSFNIEKIYHKIWCLILFSNFWYNHAIVERQNIECVAIIFIIFFSKELRVCISTTKSHLSSSWWQHVDVSYVHIQEYPYQETGKKNILHTSFFIMNITFFILFNFISIPWIPTHIVCSFDMVALLP